MPLQEWIHKLELGTGFRYTRICVAVLAVLLFLIGYNWRSYRNMNSLEAMDAAQVARNVSEGKGFTTLFIRPLSIYLIKRHNTKQPAESTESGTYDPAEIKGMHPDLANPPVYPLVLAGWMKVYPLVFDFANGVRSVLPGVFQRKIPEFNYSLDNRLWSSDSKFWWAPHDFMIALFNEALFFVVIWLIFLLARRLFDSAVAWVTAAILLGCDYLWHFTVSGLSTTLLLLIFVGIVWCLVLFEAEMREPKEGSKRFLPLVLAIGVLTGIGALTRYSFGWVIIPILVFLGFIAGQRRFAACGLALVTFLVVFTPWIFRNVNVSGTPFGTAGYAVIEGTPFFPRHQLERSLEPNLVSNFTKAAGRKLVTNTNVILTDEFPKLGGGWITPFFIVGLLLGLFNPATRRLRYLILMILLVFIVAQALGRTQLSNDSPDFNSENLLVLLLPFIVMYGVSLFFVLLDQIEMPVLQLRYAAMGGFVAIASLPMIYAFLPPRAVPVAFPPYYPPVIEQTTGWMKENELMMSDIPWAVAWYGKRQCVWMTLNPDDDFYAINDYLKSIRALYLTSQTLDGHFVSEWVRGGTKSWGPFLMETVINRRVPTTFPLRKAPVGFLPDQLFLTDWERWKIDSDSSTTGSDLK